MSDSTKHEHHPAASGHRPTLAEVAQRAGVSRSTASLAFSGAGPVSDATRARVFAAAESLGYGGPDPVARSLRSGRSGVIGVVIEERVRDAFRDPMNIAMLDGLSDGTSSLGTALLLLPDTDEPESQAPRRPGPIETAAMDAVVLVGCSTRLDRPVSVLRRRGIPIVAIEAEPMEGVLEIALDNREASATAARHLYELGHRDIAVVTLPLGPQHVAGPLSADWQEEATSYTAAQRLSGVLDVFTTLRGWMAPASSTASGIAAGRALLSDAEHRPTAIIAQSDLLAVGILRAAEELGLSVPQDISVVGFDGIRLDGYGPWNLTTLVQPAVEKGRAAGIGIARLLAGETPKPTLLRCTFRRGATTAAPRATD
ncbi:LacI family DNA-binding transcriptional regulator [Salinibacterium hongtaonis]|uniref:LacI family DNA-binding transcriptional regulator n=1 Tax=Homoserinimonas hongtaonis TaxID=2079791 RepID=UPI000D3A8730|nr:LacI family DNA-binding transcriptional regulator [Salinibacterium hongtaonis]AWB88176.1 transcriptional regulator [Salinibacterium hongtaonis]